MRAKIRSFFIVNLLKSIFYDFTRLLYRFMKFIDFLCSVEKINEF